MTCDAGGVDARPFERRIAVAVKLAALAGPAAPGVAARRPRRLRSWIAGSLALAAVAVAAFRFWPHEPLPPGLTADRVVVDKSARTLSLLRDNTVIRSYRVSLGRNPSGHKLQEGDGRTPEGLYRLDGRNARSGFYRALHVSYPSPEDSRRAAQNHVAPGGQIMVHGIKNGLGWLGRLHRLVDWTDGCIAVTNDEMRDIWNAVATGTPIEIRP
jgi:hypothetical protein